MFIGIGIILGNEIVLVADGREGNPGSPNYSNDCNKIFPFGESIVITTGDGRVADAAIEYARLNHQQNRDASEILDLFDLALHQAWLNKLSSSKNFEINENSPLAHVLLLIAGITSDGPFIGGIQVKSDGLTRRNLSSGRGTAIIICNNYTQAQDFFAAELKKQMELVEQRSFKNAFSGFISVPIFAIEEELERNQIQAVTTSAAKTIRHMEQQDESIGGVIRFAVLKSDKTYSEGVVSE